MHNTQEATLPCLKRCLGFREALAVTVGTVIGVGLFTVGANSVGELGLSIVFATFFAMLISIYPALLYAEMGAALPLAGGTYQYASLGLGRFCGMLAGWNFIISMVSVASGEALAFSFYFRTLLETLGLSLPVNDVIPACLAVVFFICLNIRGTALAGRLQNGLLFFFWGVTLVWLASMLPALASNGFQAAPPQPLSANFFTYVAMVWWCFAGFETCCALGGEICHPQINIPRALFLAPFLVFAVTSLFQWVLVCLVPAEGLAALAMAASPYAYALKSAGILGFPLFLLCLGIAFGGDFSTLNSGVAAPARYLYIMAQDGLLPKFLAKLHPTRQTPYAALLLLGVLICLLVSTGSIRYIASLSLFATLLYYIIGIAAACGLRIKQPNLKRSFRAPLIWLGAPISILVYAYMLTQLDHNAIISGLFWCLLGIILFIIYNKRCRKKKGIFLPYIPLEPPSPEEKERMDKEYHLWCSIVAFVIVVITALYAISYFA